MRFLLRLFNPYTFCFLHLPGCHSSGNSFLASISFVWQWDCPGFVYFPLKDLIQLDFCQFLLYLCPFQPPGVKSPQVLCYFYHHFEAIICEVISTAFFCQIPPCCKRELQVALALFQKKRFQVYNESMSYSAHLVLVAHSPSLGLNSERSRVSTHI